MAESLTRPAKISELVNSDIAADACYIEPGILIKRGTLLFGGHAKTGKSFGMIELARALALGEPPFGCPELCVPQQVRVLFIEQELGVYGLHKRVKTIFKNENERAYGENLWYVSKEPQLKLDTDSGVEAICREIEAVHPNVVIFDPVGKMHTLDENSNSDIEKLFNNVEKIKKRYQELDLSVIMSHHFGKPPFIPPGGVAALDPLSPYNFRGASKWFDAPDTLCTLVRGRDLNTEHKAWELKVGWTLRQDEGPDNMVLSVNKLNDLRVRYERKSGTLPALEIRKREA